MISTKPDRNPLNVSHSRGALTRDALIKAATKIFARDGFHAASTRLIADTAEVNQALIKYHFGSKHGLYIAVFVNIEKIITSRLGDRIKNLQSIIASGNFDKNILTQAIKAIAERAIDSFFYEDMDDIATLVLKEQQKPTEAFDILYEGFMRIVLESLESLFALVRPELPKQQLKILVMTIFGQVISLRAARTTLCRFMGWEKIGNKETQIIKSQISDNLKTLIGHNI